MKPVLVDSDVLLDVLIGDTRWAAWSRGVLREAADSSILVIRREPLPFPADFLAGRAFRAYRRRGGARRSPLPDFYIGAHAAVRGYRLLTRDPARYRAYYPTVELIAP